ncbi:hypothetical protein [Chondromyces crocatus]|uniref:Uncharacterized protein n=1 Tax=Chondromyces crocatus TaxID=52 RepID=A0A0K1ER35_CHOCO|nr:hypothetical protein [Chondromyces crocatus]AKT43107.1 uncharacterized protein CMC5_073350 [Chondromyces crocatus]
MLPRIPLHSRALLAALAMTAFPACGGEDPPSFDAPDRSAGERVPMTAPCGEAEELHCLLPWPSSAFSEVDTTSTTGLRVHLDAGSLYYPEDDPTSLNRADGFSRLTPIVAGFAADLDETPGAISAEGTVRLLLAQHDHPAYGQAVPLRIVIKKNPDIPGESMVFAYPQRPLEPNADYVVAVTDSLRAVGGGAVAPSRVARVALAQETPASQQEADLRGYHAPTRATLDRAGIDPARVLRVWDFTTRSADDATRRLLAMQDQARKAVNDGQVQVVLDRVDLPQAGTVAAVVEGRLVGLPAFVNDDGLTLGSDGLPLAHDTGEAPFRVSLPAGTDDYHFIMFGHGMGGTFRDDSFDPEVTNSGLAKVSIQFHGWTGDDLIPTFTGFLNMARGTHLSSARLMQALADGAAIQEAMVGPLGDVLAAATLSGQPNPLEGRRPDGSTTVWAGGSLGGSLGMVYTSADPTMRAGVLNVPGAGWTHFVPLSVVYGIVEGLLKSSYGGNLGFLHALSMSQSNWDDIDGAAWIEQLRAKDPHVLIQESIGDPVLPNAGSEMVAISAGAVMLGAALVPIDGVESASGNEVVGQSAITQYWVPGDDAYAIHGFAAESGPGGEAARQQMFQYIESVFAGEPRITLPASCTGGSCDFRGR